MEEAQNVLTRLNLSGEYEVRIQTSPGRSGQDFTEEYVEKMRSKKGFEGITAKYRIFKKGE